MRITFVTVLLAVCLCACYAQGNITQDGSGAVRCYSCKAVVVESGSCADPFVPGPDIGTVVCATGMCTKYKTVIDGKQTITRGCSASSREATTPRCGNFEKPTQDDWICFCEGNLCNTSVQLTSTTFLIVLGLVCTLLGKVFS